MNKKDETISGLFPGDKKKTTVPITKELKNMVLELFHVHNFHDTFVGKYQGFEFSFEADGTVREQLIDSKRNIYWSSSQLSAYKDLYVCRSQNPEYIEFWDKINAIRDEQGWNYFSYHEEKTINLI